MVAVPMFASVAADRAGRIAYVYGARSPQRARGLDWTRPVPGDRSDLVWSDTPEFDRLPRVVDPPSGFLQSCNGTPFHATTGGMRPLAATMAEFLRDVVGARCDAMGQSFGGWLALWLAVDHPDLLDQMVLLCPAGLRVEFILKTADTYDLNLYPLSGGEPVRLKDRKLGGTAGTPLESLAIFNRDSEQNAFLNRLRLNP